MKNIKKIKKRLISKDENAETIEGMFNSDSEVVDIDIKKFEKTIKEEDTRMVILWQDMETENELNKELDKLSEYFDILFLRLANDTEFVDEFFLVDEKKKKETIIPSFTLVKRGSKIHGYGNHGTDFFKIILEEVFG